MSYAELLKDPRWQRKRLEVLNRADFTCQECSDKTKTLHVHHTYYAKGRKPWEYDATELKCLCEDCHARVTEIGVEIQQMIGRLPQPFADTILGFVRVMDAFYGGRGFVNCENPDVAEGIALAFGTAGDRTAVLDAIGDGGRVEIGPLFLVKAEEVA